MSDLRARLILDTKGFRSGIRSATNSSWGLGKSLRGSLRGIRGQIVGVAAAYVGLAGAIRGASYASRTLASFEQEMANIRAISSDLTEDVFKRMEAEARRLGATTQFTASEAAHAMRLLKQGGLTSEESISQLEGTMHLAAAASLDMAEAADIAVKQFNVFRDAGVSVADVGDVMAMVGANSATSVDELAEAMKFASGISSNFNQDIKQVTAILGAMADVGQNGEMAGTAIRGLLADLSDETSESVRKLKGLGVAYEDINPRTRSLAEIMSRLTGDTEVMANYTAVFEKRVGQGFGAIAKNIPKFENLLGILEDSEGAVERMAKIKMDTLTGDALRLKSIVEETFLSTGLTGALRAGVQSAIAGVEKIRAIVPTVREAISRPDRWRIAGEVLKFGLMGAVNTLYRHMMATFHAAGRLMGENFKSSLKLLSVVTTKDFWMGMLNALLGIVALFGSAMYRVVAEALTAISEIPALGGLKDVAEEYRRVANGASDYANDKFSSAKDNLTPAAELLVTRLAETWKSVAATYVAALKETDGPFDMKESRERLGSLFRDLTKSIKDLEGAVKEEAKDKKAEKDKPETPRSQPRLAAGSVGAVAGAVNAIFGRSFNSNLLEVNERQAKSLERIDRNTRNSGPNVTVHNEGTFSGNV